MWGLIVLVCCCIGCFAFGGGWKDISCLGGRFGIIGRDSLAFSGCNLDDGKFWVLVSATFCHATFSHLVNNVLMLGIAATIEEYCGSLVVVILFISFGVSGWLFSYLSLRLDPSVYEFMKFADTVGASPSTYGLCAFAAMYLPSIPISAPLGIPSWLALSWLTFLPLTRTSSSLSTICIKKCSTFAESDTNTRALNLLALLGDCVFVCGLSIMCAKPLLKIVFGPTNRIPSWTWFSCYIFSGTLTRLVSGQRVNQSNEMSHLGGTFGALVVAGLLNFMTVGDRPPPSFSNYTHALFAMGFTCLGMIELVKRAMRVQPNLYTAIYHRIWPASIKAD